jgi:hypothetical protein
VTRQATIALFTHPIEHWAACCLWAEEVMRHSSYSTTADTYTHVMPAHSAEAVQTVAELFERPPQLALPPAQEATGDG